MPSALLWASLAEILFWILQIRQGCGPAGFAFSREGAFREAASAAVGLRPNRSISACQLATSKRFVVIFSITRNWTLSTTAFQRKNNRKSRKKLQKKKIRRVGKRGREAASDGGFPHRGWSRGAGLMPFARCIAAGVAPLGQRVRGVFRLPPLSLWTPLSPGRVVAPSVCYGP